MRSLRSRNTIGEVSDDNEKSEAFPCVTATVCMYKYKYQHPNHNVFSQLLLTNHLFSFIIPSTEPDLAIFSNDSTLSCGPPEPSRPSSQHPNPPLLSTKLSAKDPQSPIRPWHVRQCQRSRCSRLPDAGLPTKSELWTGAIKWCVPFLVSFEKSSSSYTVRLLTQSLYTSHLIP